MSGPDINRPKPGSNAIGSFVIGVSPIGPIPQFDYWKTVLSQYANSPILIQLIDFIFQCVDQTQNVGLFFDSIWNIATAQGYGLDIWGKIVGVTRTLTVPLTQTYFGFEEAAPGSQPFNQQPFFSGQPLTNNFALADDAYRVLILAKALFNITDGSTASINQILLKLFPNRGNCYVVDNQNMTMTYFFAFTPTPVELAIVQQSGVLPRPPGVSATVVIPPS
jgi:hypothetical protein